MRGEGYTLKITYSKVGRIPNKGVRSIPWNWYPSPTEVYDCIRRLRSQEPEAEIISVELFQTVHVETYNIGENPCES